MTDFNEVVELAKQGGRLSSDSQWVLADALKDLDSTAITRVAIESGRNEDTLLQYARAAERWFPPARVEGVSFSAHRVALSWHDPTGLLKKLKEQYGSPTVRQVRVAMGLEGHEAIETLERGIKKLDNTVPTVAILGIIDKLKEWHDRHVKDGAEVESEPIEQWVGPDQHVEIEPPSVEEEDVPRGTWKSPINTSDIIGM